MGIPEVIRTPEEEITEKIQLVSIKSNDCFNRYIREFEYLYRSETDSLIQTEYLAIINGLKACREHADQAIERLKQIKSELK